MAPILTDLFGVQATYNSTNNTITIYGEDLLSLANLNTFDADHALNIFAALVSNFNVWYTQFGDETVNGASSLSVISPTVRNNDNKTEYTFSVSFYTPFVNLAFDPDDI